MKKLTLLLIPMMMLACNSIAKYQAPIDEVSTLWGETTEMVTNFSEKVNSTISSANNVVSEHNLEDKMVKEKGEEVYNEWMSTKTNYMEALKSFGPIQSELSSLMKTWGEKTEMLTGLTEGLAAGNLEGDVMGKVNDLKETATNAKTTVEGLQENFQSANETLQGAVDQWKAKYAEIMPAE